MRALAYHGPGNKSWDDVPDPTIIDSTDAIVRVDTTTLCGTDLHIRDYDGWAQQAVRTPLVLGHEFVGEVAGIGADVVDIKVGDLVSGEGHLVCGKCRNCLAGRRHLCRSTLGLGVGRDGAFAEYLALPASNVWVHRDKVDLDVAAIFDPFGNAVHTALSFPLVGEDVLITGAGPIGIMAAAVARHAGARNVAITDVSEARLDLARKVGVDLALNVSGETIADGQRRLGLRVRELLLHELERRERALKLVPLECVRERAVDAVLERAHDAPRDAVARRVQAREGGAEPLGFGEERVVRDAHRVHEDGAGEGDT